MRQKSDKKQIVLPIQKYTKLQRITGEELNKAGLKQPGKKTWLWLQKHILIIPITISLNELNFWIKRQTELKELKDINLKKNKYMKFTLYITSTIEGTESKIPWAKLTTKYIRKWDSK